MGICSSCSDSGAAAAPSDLRGNLIRTQSCDVFSVYEKAEKLGEGVTGEVRLVKHRDTGVQYALKSINLDMVDKQQLSELRNEIALLKLLDHPNITHLYETYEFGGVVYLVMELCTGGDLAASIWPPSDAPNAHTFSEIDTAWILGRLLSAVSLCHSNNICHRDIKLPNIMFETNGPNAEPKLIDFGLSKTMVNKNQLDLTARLMQTTCGTTACVSPKRFCLASTGCYYLPVPCVADTPPKDSSYRLCTTSANSQMWRQGVVCASTWLFNCKHEFMSWWLESTR